MSAAPASAWQRWCLAAALLPVAGWVLLEAQRTFAAEWATLAAREQVLKWSAAEAQAPAEAEWQAALAQLQRGLQLTPDDPALHERLGDMYSLAAKTHWNQADVRNGHLKQAATWFESALKLRPGSAPAWAALATTYQGLGETPARVQQAWNQALKLGPFEGHVQPVLMQVVLADWDHASPAMQAWAKALFDRSDGAVQAQINVLARYYGLSFKPDRPPPGSAKP